MFFDNALNVEFGKDVFINQFCQFHIGYSDARIRIGDSVWVGMDVCFICPTHEIGSNRQRAGMALYHDITVGNGAWIGARSTILPGVTIGKGAIIAAGSVVAECVSDNELWGGVPARLIRKLND